MTTEIIRYAVDGDGIATLTLDYPGKTMNVIDRHSWIAWKAV